MIIVQVTYMNSIPRLSEPTSSLTLGSWLRVYPCIHVSFNHLLMVAHAHIHAVGGTFLDHKHAPLVNTGPECNRTPRLLPCGAQIHAVEPGAGRTLGQRYRRWSSVRPAPAAVSRRQTIITISSHWPQLIRAVKIPQRRCTHRGWASKHETLNQYRVNVGPTL